jgi:hypothetical protein
MVVIDGELRTARLTSGVDEDEITDSAFLARKPLPTVAVGTIRRRQLHI